MRIDDSHGLVHLINHAVTRSALTSVVVVLLMVIGLACGLAGCQGLDSSDSLIGPLVKEFVPPTPSQAARDAFNVYDPDKRRQSVALISAAKFGGEEAYVRMYKLLVDDPDATVRAACLHALGIHGSAEDAKIVVRHLKDPEGFVRWESAQALQKLHDPAAAGALIVAMLNDEDSDVRGAAAGALGQYAEGRVVAALIGAMSDGDYTVVCAAERSLTCLTGEDFGVETARWLAWTEEHKGDLFKGRRAYTWQPFVRPAGVLDRIQFWKEREAPAAKSPAGMTAKPVADGASS